MGSETRYDASESDSEMVHVPVRSNEHNDAKDNKDQHHYNESNAAAKVFAITELLEQVLLQVDHRALRTTLSRVSQSFHQTILGSTRLQRNLYYAPDWNHPNLSPAPIPKSMLDFTTAAYRGRTSNDPAIDNDRPTFQHIFNVRFDRSAIAWVCDPSSSTNGPFRNMLICQPPVVAMKVFCWSSDTRDYRVQLRQKHLENATGVTCGQMWDLVQASESIGGNVQVSWCFDSR